MLGRDRRQILGEPIVVQCTGTPGAEAVDGGRSFVAQFGQNEACDERRPVESHAAVGEHFLTVPHEPRAELHDGMQTDEIGKLLVVDVMVDVENVARTRGNSLIQRTFQVDDDLDAPLMDGRPIGDHWRDEEALLIINRKELGNQQIGHNGRRAAARIAKYTTIFRVSLQRVRRRALGALGIVGIAMAVTSSPASAQIPGWTDVPLPGGRATLLPALGLSSDLPRALVVQEIVRVVHAARDPHGRQLKALSAYFASPPAIGDELVPIPLAPSIWRAQILEHAGSDDRGLLGAILANRRASLLCYGLMGLDRETLAAVSADRTLLRRLYEQHSTALAAFSSSIRVRQGRLVLPGGPEMQSLWGTVLDVPFNDLKRAIPEVLGKDDGRLASFAEAIEGLDVPHTRLVLADVAAADEAALEFQALYRAFVLVEPAWKASDFPFFRIGFDPTLLLMMLPLGPDGRLSGTRAYWRTLLESDEVPESSEKWSGIDDDDPITVPELIGSLTPLSLPSRQAAFGAISFAARFASRFPDASSADRVYFTHASRRFPALVLTLERADIRELPVWQAVVSQARRLDDVLGTGGGVDAMMALFQAPIALIDRAVRVRALDSAHAAALLKSFAELTPDHAQYGRDVAAWLEGSLLPSLGFDRAAEGIQAESVLLEALTGLAAPPSIGRPTMVRWEGIEYRVDLAAPELARLTEVRAKQEGNTLDAALALARVGAALSAARDVAQVRTLQQMLRDLAGSLARIDPSERTTADLPPDGEALLRQSLSDIDRVVSRGDLKRAANAAGRLRRLEDAVLADVLTSIVYAFSLGDPEGRTFLAGNVARRHDFGRHLMTATERERTRWMVPFETAGEGEPWHVRGALLALDIGLGRLALRRTRGDLPERQPTISQGDRRVLIDTLVLTEPANLDEKRGHLVAAWLRAGRERLSAWDAASQADAISRLALDERRAQAIAWTAQEDAAAMPALFMLTELVLLGRKDGDPVPAEWGTSRAPLDGSLRLAFPDPSAPQRYSGRSGSGLMAARMADLKLAVLERLVEVSLPVALTPGVLAAALQDFLDDVRLAYFDDWLSMARRSREISADSISDYVSALTAGGPLVPASGPGTDGHP